MTPFVLKEIIKIVKAERKGCLNKKGKLRSVTNWPKPILFVQQSNNNLSTVFNIQYYIFLKQSHIHTHTHTHPHIIHYNWGTYIQLFRVIKTRIFCFFIILTPLFLPFVRKHLFHCPCKERDCFLFRLCYKQNITFCDELSFKRALSHSS